MLMMIHAQAGKNLKKIISTISFIDEFNAFDLLLNLWMPEYILCNPVSFVCQGLQATVSSNKTHE